MTIFSRIRVKRLHLRIDRDISLSGESRVRIAYEFRFRHDDDSIREFRSRKTTKEKNYRYRSSHEEYLRFCKRKFDKDSEKSEEILEQTSNDIL